MADDVKKIIEGAASNVACNCSYIRNCFDKVLVEKELSRRKRK